MGRRFSFYFSIVMVFFYLAFAAFFAFSPYFIGNIPPLERYTLASVFLLYGSYRGYSAYKKNKEDAR